MLKTPVGVGCSDTPVETADFAASTPSRNLTLEAINDARHGASQDAKARAALQFARFVAQKKGRVSDADLAEVRSAGFDGGAPPPAGRCRAQRCA